MIGAFSSLVFLSRCNGCDAWLEVPLTHSLCENCVKELHFLKTAAVLPFLKKHYFEEATSLLVYEGLALSLLHRLKFQRDFSLLKTFLSFFEGLVLDMKSYDAFVFVPTHWWRHWKRGLGLSSLLAFELGKKLKKPVLSSLKKVKRTRLQTDLSREERLQNLQDAFLISPSKKKEVKGKRILLVDDVLTTGATVNACAKVLKQSGAERVDVLTLARAL